MQAEGTQVNKGKRKEICALTALTGGFRQSYA